MRHSALGNDRFQSKLELRALKQATLNVLAVDDEPSILELLQSALPELENCTVTVAASAAEALQKIEAAEKPFDCLLVDIQMPGTTGIELLRQIRSTPGNLETPVIMLTAMNDRAYIEEAFLEGAFDYITKPFDFFELRSRMNAAHLLMMERIKTQSSSASIKNLREELDFNQRFSFEDPLSIEGLERCLRYVEFDNYIEQLSRSSRFDSWVTAIKLRDAEYRFDLNDFGAFRHAISDIGMCIEKTSQAAGAVYSYRGAGVFLVVTHGRKNTEMLPTEEHLNRKLRAVLSNRCASVHLKTVKSSPVAMRSFSKSGAFVALNKALENVKERESGLRKGMAALSTHHPDSSTSRKQEVEGRLFDTVLKEMYGDNTYLARK
ncbi:response regulator [Ruegeria arenilitoris]|uniref:response regulator n=1 Tax=Ruegeria arenilitoris TaxID=1173585 RepID=UPI00147BDACA|nr:response regulator [Ruegeria arenilitoris]